MITHTYVFQKPLASTHATVFRRKSPHLKHKIIEKFGYLNVKEGVCCVLLGNKIKRSRQKFKVASVVQISSLNLTLLFFHFLTFLPKSHDLKLRHTKFCKIYYDTLGLVWGP